MVDCIHINIYNIWYMFLCSIKCLYLYINVSIFYTVCAVIHVCINTCMCRLCKCRM